LQFGIYSGTRHYELTSLHRSLFWHADQEFFDKDIEAHSHNARESIDRAVERGQVTASDLELLKEANLVL